MTKWMQFSAAARNAAMHHGVAGRPQRRVAGKRPGLDKLTPRVTPFEARLMRPKPMKEKRNA